MRPCRRPSTQRIRTTAPVGVRGGTTEAFPRAAAELAGPGELLEKRGLELRAPVAF